MENNLTKVFSEEMNYCIEIAKDSVVNQEIMLKYENEAGKWADRLIELEKLKHEKELQEQRLAHEGKFIWVKFAGEAAKDVVVPVILLVLKNEFMTKQTIRITAFEKDGILTTSAGKELKATVRPL